MGTNLIHVGVAGAADKFLLRGARAGRMHHCVGEIVDLAKACNGGMARQHALDKRGPGPRQPHNEHRAILRRRLRHSGEPFVVEGSNDRVNRRFIVLHTVAHAGAAGFRALIEVIERRIEFAEIFEHLAQRVVEWRAGRRPIRFAREPSPRLLQS
jgi:hypothetical protein